MRRPHLTHVSDPALPGNSDQRPLPPPRQTPLLLREQRPKAQRNRCLTWFRNAPFAPPGITVPAMMLAAIWVDILNQNPRRHNRSAQNFDASTRQQSFFETKSSLGAVSISTRSLVPFSTRFPAMA